MLEALRDRADGTPFGRGSLARALSDYQEERRHEKHEEEVADAYRDAAIANAVVNVIGILVSAGQQERGHAAQGPPAGHSAPPKGHYETERVLVQEGHYEDHTVYVPEHVDPRTGQKVRGHYETRKRWVPPVYEYRAVWVER